MPVDPAPTVSVVMPTYNRADLLPRSVRSVLGQGFDDLELLIVDDGSTDNTEEVVGEIRERDTRVRYLKLPENRGIGFARDAGLRRVSGRYIGMADSDDIWLPGKLETQVGIMEQYPEVEILFSDFWDVDHLGGTKAKAFVKTRLGMEHLVVRLIADDLYIVDKGVETGILRKCFIQLGTVLLRRDLLDTIGGFDVSLSGPEDLEFCWRAAVLGAQYAYTRHLFVERHRSDSSVTGDKVGSWLGVLDALKVCRRTCQSAHRLDLLSLIRTAEHRAWRNLMFEYGQNHQRSEVIRAFGRDLDSGFSARSLMVFASALLGPRIISSVRAARASMGRMRESA